MVVKYNLIGYADEWDTKMITHEIEPATQTCGCHRQCHYQYVSSFFIFSLSCLFSTAFRFFFSAFCSGVRSLSGRASQSDESRYLMVLWWDGSAVVFERYSLVGAYMVWRHTCRPLSSRLQESRRELRAPCQRRQEIDLGRTIVRLRENGVVWCGFRM